MCHVLPSSETTQASSNTAAGAILGARYPGSWSSCTYAPSGAGTSTVSARAVAPSPDGDKAPAFLEGSLHALGGLREVEGRGQLHDEPLPEALLLGGNCAPTKGPAAHYLALKGEAAPKRISQYPQQPPPRKLHLHLAERTCISRAAEKATRRGLAIHALGHHERRRNRLLLTTEE